jgi:flagellar hook-associated protein 1 FlgK
VWSAFVVDLGVKSASATSRATVAEAARATASAAQLAQTSVDTDEETVNMLAFQRAYEGAARVLTAVDEMLDTLINRTGVVGR